MGAQDGGETSTGMGGLKMGLRLALESSGLQKVRQRNADPGAEQRQF